jgi:putative molybdopterin biosynthesis protein
MSADRDGKQGKPRADDDLLAAVREAARQEQFLEVVSAEVARTRFESHLDRSPLPGERVELSHALGRVLAHDLAAPIDVPPFDRANVDGFAIRSADSAGAADAAPRRLVLNAEVVACGHAPTVEVRPGTATTIATGGVVPRGADAVVMVEHTELVEAAPAIELRRGVSPGQFISYAGSDIARGETLMRRGQVIGSREIGMLAACGLAAIEVVRRPKVAVLSTGDEIVALGESLRPGGVYDSNGAIAEAGGEPESYGAFPDDATALEQAVRRALAECDMVVLSGGTSKGAGDLSHRVVSGLGKPGILVHGVALKPGKPLCLAVAEGKPVAVLPGFPTSAIFTFHAFVAPVIRARAGLPPEATETVEARVPLRIASEMGRKEFVLVSLVADEHGAVAFPSAKGSGAVTSFSQADGFIEIDALAAVLDAGTNARVTLIGASARAPDLVIMGSHDIALDVVVGALAERGIAARTIAVGSQGGVAAAARGQCDVAPVHLVDPATGVYNTHLLAPGLSLVKGWQRMQGVLFRPGDTRFEGKSAETAVKAALADPHCMMVNRNAGAGTRVLIDKLLARLQAERAPVGRPESAPLLDSGARSDAKPVPTFAERAPRSRPPGYANQPRSHNAVAAAVAQARADWGVAIEPVAKIYGLGFLPLSPEDYDFLLVESRRDRPAVQAFLAALRDPQTRARIRALGMQPAGD